MGKNFLSLIAAALFSFCVCSHSRRALPLHRIFFYWESIASLPKSKRLDMLFLCATAIGAAITSEGMSRYMIHYFGHGFEMVAYILFVSWVRVEMNRLWSKHRGQHLDDL